MKKKSKKKNINIFKIMWVGGIYLLLIVILYLVVIYKVKWEYQEDDDNKTYVYFYKCDNKVCLTNEELTNYYSRLECSSTCPVIKNILDSNIVVLDYNNTTIKYNYLTGEIMKEGSNNDN